MKKLALVIATVLFCMQALAQDQNSRQNGHPSWRHHWEHNHMRPHGRPPFAYIGPSTGVNNPAGYIGFDFDIPVGKYVTVGAGAGASSWGNKFHVDAKYFLRRYQRGWALGGGFTSNTGQDKYQTRRPEPTVAGIKESVYLNLYAQHNIFFAIYHYWTLGRRYNRFFTELGWSVPLAQDKFVQISGDQLTQSSADKIDRLAPGGLVIGCGFSFGLHH